MPLTDGSLVFASDLPGYPQVFLQTAPGAWPERLTMTTERTLPIAEAHSGIVVRHDRGGNEAWQLSLVTRDGRVQLLTSDMKAMHVTATLSPDRRQIGLAYNPGGQDDFRLGVLDLRSGLIEDWLCPKGWWHWQAWSPDGTAAIVSHQLSSTSIESYLVRPGREPQRLLPDAGRVTGVAWRDSAIYALTDLGSEFLGVAEIDPQQLAAPSRWLVRADGDVEAFQPDDRGVRVAAVLNQGSFDQLIVCDLERRTEPSVVAAPGPGLVYSDNASSTAEHLAWAPDGGSLYVSWESPVEPSDILQLPEGRRWTFAGGGRRAELVMPAETSFRSYDGLEVPGLLYPAGDGPRPTVVYFHGGPESQLRGNFQPLFQMLNAAGIAVFAPNVRGSSGYGLRYLALDDRGRRWDAVRDGCEAGRHLRSEGIASTVAAIGASYGGFMTLAVLVEDPTLWTAGVDIVGIADWHTFLKNTSGWRRAARMAEYGDPEGEESAVLAEMSPLRRAGAIKAPLLVIHGRNDIRVPVGEAEQIAAAAGAELMMFDDEGHGIVKHGNRVRAFSRVLGFLTERLTSRSDA